MQTAIIGAGLSGIVTARTLRAVGIDVVVYDKAPDVGGVWSASRSYPGISTQNDKSSYIYSDFPMGPEIPENPSGAQVREHLQRYVEQHGLADSLRLGTEVLSAAPLPLEAGWSVASRSAAGESVEQYDELILANGVFSMPNVPPWPGREAFEAAGGRILTASDVPDAGRLAGGDVVVVGWGKSACDIAAAAMEVATSTTVVARSLSWKVPRRLGRVVLYRHLLLSRYGEYLMWHPRTKPMGTVLTQVHRVARGLVLRFLQRAVARQQGLDAHGLRPPSRLSNSNSQTTVGFFEAVAEGRIAVRTGLGIEALGVRDGRPVVELVGGETLPADSVVAATGYDQDLSFLSPEVVQRLRDQHGALLLYRRILPPDVPHLMFVGWVASMLSPLSAELQAMWIATHLRRGIALPPVEQQRETAQRYYLTHLDAARAGAQQIPNEWINDLDLLIGDIGLALPPGTRWRQWVRPVDPRAYRRLLPTLVEQLGSAERAAGSRR